MKDIKEIVPPSEASPWYKDAIIYELHIRSFSDSDGDGMGDFPGLTAKLDYLQDLGVTAIWLLPFYPSPWKDDGYDIADYTDVHPAYGTLSDFKVFLREAHLRGLRVITELVLNHTSDQHAWFQRARRAPPSSAWRDFYVWSDRTDKYKEARIIFNDFETSNWAWDSVAHAYYWHRFYSHQPDLNFDNPRVRKALLKVVDFWLSLGVDGLRLDAVPYLYERENTNCENLPETHMFLKELRSHVDQEFQDRMLLAEANQWPEDAATYFGDGDACHMAFHFPLMPRMFMAVRMEDRYPVIDILQQTPPIPPNAQWALFLRNHDELTLEMVTDEERDYMYRMYAHDERARLNLGIRHRLSPLLEKDRKKVALMSALLFSLPGTPVIYYGDEIGMGDNIYLGDRNGVRTPMQWSADRNAGFSKANPQRLFLPIIIDPDYHYEVVNVDTCQNNLHSVLWFMKRLIAQRKRYQTFGRGTLEFLYPENRRVLAFVRRDQEEVILVIANLSRFTQYCELDLSAFKGMVPIELFGQTPFPPVGDQLYFVTLGPHDFYWFSLERRQVTSTGMAPVPDRTQYPLIVVGSWGSLFQRKAKLDLQAVLRSYLQSRGWSLGQLINSVKILEMIHIPCDSMSPYLAILQVNYTEEESEICLLPCALATGEKANVIRKGNPDAVIADLMRKGDRETGIFCEVIGEEPFRQVLLEAIDRRRRFKGTGGEVRAFPTQSLHAFGSREDKSFEPSIVKESPFEASITYKGHFVLTIFRHLTEGTHPDLEMGLFLSERIPSTIVPPLLGAIEYNRRNGQSTTLAVLQRFLQHEGSAWNHTIDILGRFYERVLVGSAQPPELPLMNESLLDLVDKSIPESIREVLGSYPEIVRLLGRRTAELHLALSSDTENPDFRPEPLTRLYQRSIYQSMRNLTHEVVDKLRQRSKDSSTAELEEIKQVLDLEGRILSRFQALLEQKIIGQRIRVHGDYQLGNLLFTGKDFIISNFARDGSRPRLSQRHTKHSGLLDVASMIRSFQAAACSALFDQLKRGVVRAEDLPRLKPWARLWHAWVSSSFLKIYLEVSGQGSFIPQSRGEIRLLLNTYLLAKFVEELGYELDGNSDGLKVALKSLLQLMETNL